MKTRQRIIFLSLLGLLAVTGVADGSTARTREAAESEDLSKLKKEELAKMILKPRKYKLDISKDPFMPLHYTDAIPDEFSSDEELDRIKQFEFRGISKMDNEYIAFLQNGNQKGVYRISDYILGYQVTKINEDRIILTNGSQTVTLRRNYKGGRDEKL